MKIDAILNVLTPFWNGEKLDICIFCNSESAACFMKKEMIERGIVEFECLPDKNFKIKIFNNPIIICENLGNDHILVIDYNKCKITKIVTV